MKKAGNIKRLLSKTRNHLDELKSLIDERDKLVNVLRLEPSANDNYNMINDLERTSKTLKYLHQDFLTIISDNKGIDKEEYQQLAKIYRTFVSDYYKLTDALREDLSIDVQEYQAKDLEIADFPQQNKSVRFEEVSEPTNVTEPSFTPFRDEEETETGTVHSFESQTNPELFALHQQQILAQDEDLGELHGSVRRQHNMGLQINDELDDHMMILDDLEQGVGESLNRLDRAARRLGAFRKKCQENGSLLSVIILTVILILLLVVLN